MTIARRFIISGHVQGVFYRGWMVETATALNLAGWVRNRRSGDVEALVIGPAEAVEALIARCRRGPSAAKVEHVAIEAAEIVPVKGFTARPTI